MMSGVPSELDLYFTSDWKINLYQSLFNFLSVAISHVPLPKLTKLFSESIFRALPDDPPVQSSSSSSLPSNPNQGEPEITTPFLSARTTTESIASPSPSNLPARFILGKHKTSLSPPPLSIAQIHTESTTESVYNVIGTDFAWTTISPDSSFLVNIRVQTNEMYVFQMNQTPYFHAPQIKKINLLQSLLSVGPSSVQSSAPSLSLSPPPSSSSILSQTNPQITSMEEMMSMRFMDVQHMLICHSGGAIQSLDIHSLESRQFQVESRSKLMPVDMPLHKSNPSGLRNSLFFIDSKSKDLSVIEVSGSKVINSFRIDLPKLKKNTLFVSPFFFDQPSSF